MNPNYAGVSTTADYEYLVSSLGYSGYDSMITEKNWQEFMSYEYAVLMDVAEFIWDGQEEYNEEQGGEAYVDKTLGPYPQEYYDNDSTGIAAGSTPTEAQKGPAYMPYLPVIQDYNSAKISFEDWQKLVLAGQPSARFGISDPGALTNSPGFNVSSTIMGGNRDVMPPTLMYEYRTNPYEPEADGSLVPYITVLKEQLDYHYFTVGNREEFEGLGPNPDSGGVNFNAAHIDKVDLMEISQILNIENPYIRNSTPWSNYWLHADDNPTKSEDNWPVADTVFEQNLYFTNEYMSTIYKTPLQVMIDRYLPKASLLTSWYYLKDTDIASAEAQGKTEAAQGSANKFNVEQLMRDVKEIYNYYCWENPEGAESLTSATVDSVTYSGDGTVIRDDDGKAIIGSKNINYATTNNETFIHFGQAGIEANLFNVFHMFEPKGEHKSIPRPEAPATVTGDDTLTVVPVITELLSDKAEFMDRFGFKVKFNYDYKYSYIRKDPIRADSATTFTISRSCHAARHVTGLSAGATFSVKVDSTTCSSCASLSSHNGKKVTSVTFSMDDTATVTINPTDGEGNQVAPGTIIGWTRTYCEDYEYNKTGNIIIPYEATNNEAPRGGDNYGNGYSMDKLSQMIHDQVILRAEEEIMKDPVLLEAATHEIESMETEFVNHTYWYPEKAVKKNNKIKAATISYFDENYKRPIAFYNFGAVGATTADQIKTNFKNEINEIFAQLTPGSNLPAPKDPFTQLAATTSATDYATLEAAVKEYLEAVYNTTTKLIPTPSTNIPRNPPCTYWEDKQFLGVTNIYGIDITGGIAENATGYYQTNEILKNGTLTPTAVTAGEYNKAPQYTKLKDQMVYEGGELQYKYQAIYDIDDYVLSMSMDVPQKRVSTMIVTDVEAWAKSATYTISIHNNTFDYTNYRYVVPHSFFNFGVKVFRIDENPTYRTQYYKEYFSKINDPNAGIKEADILTMMLKWEEFARSGNDTAYAYMRDLYKLVIYVREKFKGSDPQILDTAYTYLYVPDTIWEFREGISQEAFWTERLAAEMPGNADALSQEELEFVRVKKDDISWQILDYDEYSECQYEENGELKAKVYALFPFGSPYTRTFMMETAIDKGMFNDGGYKNGHAGADWTSRATNAKILSEGTSPGFEGTVEEQIYEYELKLRTARKILNTSIDLDTRLDRAKAVILSAEMPSDPMVEAAAKEINAELKEYTVKSPIVSVAGGLCTKADYNCYSGFAVAVIHTATGRSADTSYVHMRRWPCVQEGDIVGPGTVVGHEGTTGNSRGNHLHQNLSIGGDRDSPAEYMGPIFAPFYNKDKIFETFTMIDSEWGGTKELILGTEYMELIRTVLMYPLNPDGTFKDGGALFGTPDGAAQSIGGTTPNSAALLKESTFYTENGKEYINYGAVDEEDPEVALYSTGTNKVIVKIGGYANPKYYECNIVWEDVPTENSEDELNYNSQGLKRMRVTSKTEVNMEDIVINPGIKVKIDMSSYGIAPVVWGNNVPLSVLIEDMADAVDITVLNTQRAFKPEDYASEFAGSSNDPTKKTSSANVKDVTADPELFTPDSDRMEVPDWIISYMIDIDSPFSVPFYDGPLNIAGQNSLREPGEAGTQSGDVILLKKALIMKGFATGDEIDLTGEYDAKLVAVLQKVYASGGPYSALTDFGNGETGAGDLDEWSNKGVYFWNAVVTYGSIDNAQKAGRAAASMGATIAGLEESFVHAVARHESSFVPTAESQKWCYSEALSNYIRNPSYPNEVGLSATEEGGPSFSGVIEYKDVERTLRRAQGLMQFKPSVGFSRARAKIQTDDVEQIVRMLRSPKSNAELGAELLKYLMYDKDGGIVGNEARYNTLKAHVDANPAFAEMEKDAPNGVTRYEIALMGCAALMYNQGGSYVDDVINSLPNIRYEGGKVSGSGGICGVGYWVDVMDEIVDNRIG